MCISIVYREPSSVHRTYHLLLVWVSNVNYQPGVACRAEPLPELCSKQARSFCYCYCLLVTHSVCVNYSIHNIDVCYSLLLFQSINQIAFHVKQELFIVCFSINIQKLFRYVNEIIKKYNNLNYSVCLFMAKPSPNFTLFMFLTPTKIMLKRTYHYIINITAFHWAAKSLTWKKPKFRWAPKDRFTPYGMVMFLSDLELK